MKKAIQLKWKIAFLTCLTFQLVSAQTGSIDSLTKLLHGRWEITAYSEQGMQVDKKAPARPQALNAFGQIRWERAKAWYGYSAYEDLSRRENRAFEHWQERDSIIEVQRIADAIALPYFAVFFPDSTLAVYNKAPQTNLVTNPESRRYIFSPGTMGLDISLPGGYALQWQAQVLTLTADRMTLFLPEEGEVVELVKTAFFLP
ncbi:MAG: hypothetical protein ACKVU2_02795 [Saprospiraceae bacterium]